MQIPQALYHFDTPTLLLVVQSRKARCFEIKSPMLNELEPIYTDRVEAEMPDDDKKERYNEAPSTAGSLGGVSSMNDPESRLHLHYDRVFKNHFFKQLKSLEASYDKLYIFLPESMKSTIQDELPDQLKEKTKFIYGNYGKHEPLELLKIL